MRLVAQATWLRRPREKEDVERIYALLEEHGEAVVRDALVEAGAASPARSPSRPC